MELYFAVTDIEKGTKVLVCHFVKPIAQSGRNVTTDRYKKSVDLAEALYHAFKLTLVVTL